jgi:hypothetical protein
VKAEQSEPFLSSSKTVDKAVIAVALQERTTRRVEVLVIRHLQE